VQCVDAAQRRYVRQRPAHREIEVVHPAEVRHVGQRAAVREIQSVHVPQSRHRSNVRAPRQVEGVKGAKLYGDRWSHRLPKRHGTEAPSAAERCYETRLGANAQRNLDVVIRKCTNVASELLCCCGVHIRVAKAAQT